MKGIGQSAGRSRTEERAELVQLVAFSVGDGEYALDIMRIKEIINPTPITQVPKAPAFIEGVIELRGAILPIVDMRKRFDLPPTAVGRLTKFLIVAIDVGARRPDASEAQAAARRMIVGLIVDKVSEPLRLGKDQIRPAPQLAAGDTPYFTGVARLGGRILMVLDLDALLSAREKSTLSGLGEPNG
jgi:purine-binding chemotaxis protein CheW